MADDTKKSTSGLTDQQTPAIRYLVESALKSLSVDSGKDGPLSRSEWLARFGEALMHKSPAEHQKVLSALVANGVSNAELFQYYIPEASRYLGEKWVNDSASFVDVTTGAARLQALFRDREASAAPMQILDRSIPLGQSVLMVIPQFEQHSLGAFVAADGMRRHGLWVRMAIGLTQLETAELIASNRFSFVGISLATWKSVEKTADFVDYLRTQVDGLPPVVVGGRVIEDQAMVEQRTGADFAVKSVREVIERCGLASLSNAPADGEVI